MFEKSVKDPKKQILVGIKIKMEHFIGLWNMKNTNFIRMEVTREKHLSWMVMFKNFIVLFPKEIFNDYW